MLTEKTPTSQKTKPSLRRRKPGNRARKTNLRKRKNPSPRKNQKTKNPNPKVAISYYLSLPITLLIYLNTTYYLLTYYLHFYLLLPAKPKAKKVKKDSDSDEDSEEESEEGDDEDDDSEEWDETSSDDDSDVDISENKDIYTRAFWVKKAEVVATKKVRVQKPAGNAQKKDKEKKEVVDKKKVEEDKVYTPELIAKKLKELIAMRGKRGTDRKVVVENLKILATKATSPVVMLKVKTALAAAIFDSVLNTVKYMPSTLWRECLACLLDMIKTLKDNPNVRLSEDEEVAEAFDEEEDGFLSLESLMMDEEAKAKKEAEKRKRDEEVVVVSS